MFFAFFSVGRLPGNIKFIFYFMDNFYLYLINNIIIIIVSCCKNTNVKYLSPMQKHNVLIRLLNITKPVK